MSAATDVVYYETKRILLYFRCSPQREDILGFDVYPIIDFFTRLLLSQYAQETQHEKILRGLAVGIAFTMYGRLEEADPLVTSLCADKDPILRRSGMYTLAMAYCGTGNNQAIRKLLHVAVSVYLTRALCVDSVFLPRCNQLVYFTSLFF